MAVMVFVPRVGLRAQDVWHLEEGRHISRPISLVGGVSAGEEVTAFHSLDSPKTELTLKSINHLQ